MHHFQRDFRQAPNIFESMSRFRLLVMAGGVVLSAPAFSGSSSAQGYTGYVNAPSAEVVPASRVDLQYNNQIDRVLHPAITTSGNVLFSVGVWPGVELGGRATNSGSTDDFGAQTNLYGYGHPSQRDLSGNIKIRLLQQDGWLPSFAVGMQDFAGEAIKYKARYAVGTYRWGGLEVSAGLGDGRLDGVFGGLEYQPVQYLSLLADYDAEQTSYAVRLNTGDWLGDHRIDVMYRFAADDRHPDNFWALTWQLPMGAGYGRSQPVAPDEVAPAVANDQSSAVPAPAREPAAAPSCTDALVAELLHLGMERVRVGRSDGELVVAFENMRYNRSVVDGFGLVLGATAKHCASQYQQAVLLLRDDGLVKTWLRAELEPASAYFAGDDGAFAAMAKTADAGLGKPRLAVRWLMPDTGRKTFVETMFDPAMSYTVGSEPGLYDYSIALRTQFRIPLWVGAEFLAARTDNVTNTDDFEEGGFFYGSRVPSEWSDIYLRQATRVSNTFYNVTHVGVSNTGGDDNRSFVTEFAWLPFDGPESLMLKYAWFQYDKPILCLDTPRQCFVTGQPVNPRASRDDTRHTLVGTYRWYSPKRDLEVDVSYGRFLYGDNGTRVFVQRHFGDTVFGVFYRYSDGGKDQAGGIQLSLPLTPRRNADPRLGVSVTGNPAWQTALETTVNREDNTNTINRALLVETLPPNNMQRDFLDRGRLSGAELLNGWVRMRDAWVTFGG